MTEVATYPEMNAQIVGLLRIREDDPTCGYAAARIEALEAEVRSLHERLEAAERERDEAAAAAFVLREAAERVVDVADHSVPIDLIANLSAAIEQLRVVLTKQSREAGE